MLPEKPELRPPTPRGGFSRAPDRRRPQDTVCGTYGWAESLDELADACSDRMQRDKQTRNTAMFRHFWPQGPGELQWMDSNQKARQQGRATEQAGHTASRPMMCAAKRPDRDERGIQGADTKRSTPATSPPGSVEEAGRSGFAEDSPLHPTVGTWPPEQARRAPHSPVPPVSLYIRNLPLMRHKKFVHTAVVTSRPDERWG